MDECFDVSVDTGLDTGFSDSLDTGIEPIVDIPVEEPMDSMTDIELPISETALTELQDEAAALEIQPLDDGVDLGFNYDEAMAELETQTEDVYEPSTFENMINAGAAGATSPSWAAEMTSELIAPSGAEDVTAQGLQAAANAAVVGAEGFMDAAHRQHAFPSAPLEGVDFIRNADGTPEPISPMVHTTDENGESVWVRDELGG